MVGESELISGFSIGSVDGLLVTRVREHLARGGLLIHPTETVYGIGSAIDEPGLQALARLKHREEDKPFLLLVAGDQMLAELGVVVTPVARKLIANFWPGPVTLVLPSKGDRLSPRLLGPRGGVAVRQPSFPATLALIEALGMPITSTSANPTGSPPASSPRMAAGYFPQAIANGELLMLDAGPLPSAQPSTIVVCLDESPRLIREGAVTRSEIEMLVGDSSG